MKNKYIVFIAPILLGIGYGILAQASARNEILKEVFSLMSIGYIFILPFVIGVITVYFASPENAQKWSYRIFAPLLTSSICLVISMLIGWEGLICLIMALPIYLPIASLGGIFTGILLSVFKKNTMHSFAFAALLLTPFVSSHIETRLNFETEIREVHTQIQIDAPKEKVWKNIVRIPKITEPQKSFFYTMGFPRPVEATLSFEGIDGVREAIFEKGLLFLETITIWEENKIIGFKIKADPRSTPLTTLDEHVVVGGEYFDTLFGQYEIIPINENSVNLKLFSRYRLSTRFNFYAEIWSDFLMRDIQNNILSVIKSRVEEKRLSL
jgi:hypothetical protein